MAIIPAHPEPDTRKLLGMLRDLAQFYGTDLDAVLASWGLSTAEADITALQLKSKYQAALINGVHMMADTGVAALVALAGGATQAAANAQANALKAAFAVHAASVGTATVDGAHLAADTGNAATLAAVADASDEATSITLVNALLVAYNTHGDQSGVHFHDDATLAAGTITTDPPTTLGEVITDLNDLLTLATDHFALASV